SIDGSQGGDTAHILTSDLIDGEAFDCTTSTSTTGGGRSNTRNFTSPSKDNNTGGTTSTNAGCNDITITVTNSDAELTYSPSTGIIRVKKGTPAGTYTLDYTICEVLNPSNCSSATETVNVTAAALSAANDTATSTDGKAGNSEILNVLDNDKLGGTEVKIANVTLSAVTSVPSELTFDPSTGVVGVNPNTPSGVYTFDYEICEKLNPTNCETRTVSVTIDALVIQAMAETTETINGSTGGTTAHILTSDMMGGKNFNCDNTAVISIDRGGKGSGGGSSSTAHCNEVTINVTSIDSEIQFDETNRKIFVPEGTPAGTYTLDYTICEVLNPSNCSSATETVIVTPSDIDAVAEQFTSINGATGGETDHILVSDRFHGMPFDCSGTVATDSKGNTLQGVSCNDIVVTVTNSDAELTYNPSTGFINVAAGTPAGTYTLDYTICEVLNPSNCSAVTETVNVTASALSASNDTV
ncbi:MAG: hypothetical protein ACPGVT_14565, partial [Maricaulaceae bacterium]